MAVKGMFFYPSEETEFHLVQGATLDLGSRLLIKLVGGTQQRGNVFVDPGSTLRFIPLLRDPGGGGGVIRNAGVDVDTRTGIITAWAALPPLFKSNFIVEAIITQVAPAGGTTPPPIKRFVRIHLHRSISSIWLTPESLTVIRTRPLSEEDRTRKRFSLRAAFDDGTVGDITSHRSELGITWTNAANAHLWEAGNISSPEGAVIIPGGSGGAAPFQVTASLGTLTASSTARVMSNWRDWMTTVNIHPKLVPGGAVESNIGTEKANMLFISEGFPNTDEAAFDSYVRGVVDFIGQPITRPYDLLKPRIAFWSVFLRQFPGGVSHGGEVYATGVNGAGHVLKYVPHPVQPRQDLAPNGAWTLVEMIYCVGLPVRGERTREMKSDETLRAEWRALLKDDPGPHLTDGLISEWRVLADRGVLDDVDSVLGLRAGSFSPNKSEALITLDTWRLRRTGMDGLDGLLNGLTLLDGTAFSGVWDELSATTRTLSWPMVCIVSSSHGRAVNQTSEGFFHLNQHAMFEGMRATKPSAGRFILVPTPPINDAPPDAGRTYAHELTHSFRIGDEYGDENQHANLPDTTEEIDRRYGNLQTDASAMDPSTHLISGNQIKWRWHRIQRAAEIEGTIQRSSSNTLFVPLKGLQESQFHIWDRLYIRKRVLQVPLVKRPELSQLLLVVSVLADRLEVRVADQQYHYDGVLIGLTDIPAYFPSGSIIYRPIPSPASINDPTYSFLELVAHNVKNFINRPPPKPLTPWPSVYSLASVQVPLLAGIGHLPDGFTSNLPKVVGLYSGGSTYHTGVFHPTGHCMMRDDHADGREFCMVCRYLLVDALDPSQHGTIDRDYTSNYPMRF